VHACLKICQLFPARHPPQSALSYALLARDCAGGLTIDLFGIKLGLQESLPQQMPRPRLSTLLESFLQQGPQPKPLRLPIRWTEEHMAVEEVRRGVCRSAASGIHAASNCSGLYQPPLPRHTLHPACLLW
jgi:hypothetical protein